jgi:hypothetical protein
MLVGVRRKLEGEERKIERVSYFNMNEYIPSPST